MRLMQRTQPRTLCPVILAVMAILVTSPAFSIEWPWQKNDAAKGSARNVTLNDVVAAPSAYLNRKLTFKVRFATQGKLFKQFNTKFKDLRYANFAAWSPDVQLWTSEARKTVIPTFYISLVKERLIRELKDLKRYELIQVTVEIAHDYAGLPWFEVLNFKVVEEEDDVINERILTHIRHAMTLKENGQYRVANAQFQMAVDEGLPSVYRGIIHAGMGECYSAQNLNEEALAAYGRAIEAEPEETAYYVERAKVELEMEMAQAALADCEKALSISADYPVTYALMGEAYGMMGQTSKGLKMCDLLEATPNATAEQKALAEVHRARVYKYAERYAEAIRAYARAIGTNSPLAAAPWLRKEIGQIYETRYHATGDIALLDEAIREYDNANVITRNNDAEGLYLLARARFEKVRATNGTNFQEVNDILEQVETVDSTYVPAQLLAGHLALIQQRPEDARKIFERVVEENPGNVKAHLSLAEVYEQAGQKDMALSAYRTATTVEPGNVEVWRKMAELAEKQDKLELARDAYAKLTALVPDEDLYSYQLGRLALKLDDYEVAANASAAAAGSDLQGQKARYNQGIALWAQGMHREAEAAMAQLLGDDPENVDAMIARAHLLANMEMNLDTAAELANKVMAKEKKNAIARDVLGWVELKQGQTGKAIKTLEAIPADGRSRAAWYHLGMAYHEAGMFAEATDALQKAQAPLRAGEVAGIAQQIIKNASKILPEAMKDEREARRQAQIRERIARREAERRERLEALRQQRQESREEVALAEEELSAADELAPVAISEETTETAAAGMTENEAAAVASETAGEAAKPVWFESIPAKEDPAEAAAETTLSAAAEAGEEVAVEAELEKSGDEARATTGKEKSAADDIPQVPETLEPFVGAADPDVEVEAGDEWFSAADEKIAPLPLEKLRAQSIKEQEDALKAISAWRDQGDASAGMLSSAPESPDTERAPEMEATTVEVASAHPSDLEGDLEGLMPEMADGADVEAAAALFEEGNDEGADASVREHAAMTGPRTVPVTEIEIAPLDNNNDVGAVETATPSAVEAVEPEVHENEVTVLPDWAY